MNSTAHLFIVGAGFSFNAGLPLTGGFTKALLDVSQLKEDGPSNLMVDYLRGFVQATFGTGPDSDEWPALEDVFTLVDLSANTGHHLGSNYSAASLRTVRRALIVRVMRMLQQRYARRKDDPDENWARLHQLLERLDLDTSAILSLNWDCVVERGLKRAKVTDNFDYGCGARAAEFRSGKLIVRRKTNSDPFTILKPHGSINWLYCDACRELFWIRPDRTDPVAQTLFRSRDWLAVGVQQGQQPRTLDPHCPECRSTALGTRLATFSYRKALDFPMHEATWRRAEELLREAATWIFFGYSMPGADFEFKHLLKRVELSRRVRPNIVVVTGGDAKGVTLKAYRDFFGEGTKKSRFFLKAAFRRRS